MGARRTRCAHCRSQSTRRATNSWAVNTHTFGQRGVRITTALWYFITLPSKKKPNQTEEISHQIIKRSLHNNPAGSGTPVIPSPPGIPRTDARRSRYAGTSAGLLRSQSWSLEWKSTSVHSRDFELQVFHTSCYSIYGKCKWKWSR